MIDLEVVDSTLVLVVVWINQTSLLPGQSLFLDKSTLCSLMEVFQWVGVDETETGPEQSKNLRLFTDTYFTLSLIEFFKAQVDLKKQPIIALLELLFGNPCQLFKMLSLEFFFLIVFRLLQNLDNKFLNSLSLSLCILTTMLFYVRTHTFASISCWF